MNFTQFSLNSVRNSFLSSFGFYESRVILDNRVYTIEKYDKLQNRTEKIKKKVKIIQNNARAIYI